jgi:hypothetical protein
VHSVFGKNKLWWFKTQQLILGTDTAIWWVTEPHWYATIARWSWNRPLVPYYYVRQTQNSTICVITVSLEKHYFLPKISFKLPSLFKVN